MTLNICWFCGFTLFLLLAGGVMGLVKAGKQNFAYYLGHLRPAALALCAAKFIRPFYVADVLVGLLVVVFGMRFAKGRKFMPSGLMLGLSAVVLAVLLLVK